MARVCKAALQYDCYNLLLHIAQLGCKFKQELLLLPYSGSDTMCACRSSGQHHQLMRDQRHKYHVEMPHVLQIHWFSIINSCVTVLLLTGFLATILMRVLKKDFVKYTRDDEGVLHELCITLVYVACIKVQPPVAVVITTTNMAQEAMN